MENKQLHRHVKVVCTLGPASNTREIIQKMCNAGMNVARLNFNYGTREEHHRLIDNTRIAGKNLKLPIAILADLPGLKKYPHVSIKEAFKSDIEFLQTQKVDYIALSFISNARQVLEVKELLSSMHYEIPLIVKIEKAPALENSEAILDVSEGIMVARGDLAIQISIEKVPLAQKRLIKAANQRGKPVITATEMLESMVRSLAPTRAEATDVANAVLDGTDALMLSEESATGKYPVKTIEMMIKIALEAETAYPYGDRLRDAHLTSLPEINDATARAACQIADQIGSKAIVAFTNGGTTALRVAKYRPAQPVIAVTPSEIVMRRLALVWGVNPVKLRHPASLEEIFEMAAGIAKKLGVVKKGQNIVLTAGLPLMVSGSTNLVKVHTV